MCGGQHSTTTQLHPQPHVQLLVSNHAAGEEAGAAMLELADVGVIDAVVILGFAAQILAKHAREDVSHILK